MPQRRERRGEGRGREGRGKERKEDSHTARKKERDKQTRNAEDSGLGTGLRIPTMYGAPSVHQTPILFYSLNFTLTRHYYFHFTDI